MRIKHSVRGQLRPLVQEIARQLERQDGASDAIARVLEGLVGELRAKSDKAARDRQIVREFERLLPKLQKARELVLRGISAASIDAQVGLSPWIDEVDARTSLAEIVTMLVRPRLGDCRLVAYEILGKIPAISLSGHRVKTIYNAARRARR